MIAFSAPSAASSISGEGDTTPANGNSSPGAGTLAATSFQRIFAAAYSDTAANSDKAAGDAQPTAKPDETASAGDQPATKSKSAHRSNGGNAGDIVNARGGPGIRGNASVRSRGAADVSHGDFSLSEDSSLPTPASAPLPPPDKPRQESPTTPAAAPDKQAAKAGSVGNPASGLDGLAFGLRVTPAGARPGDGSRLPTGSAENQPTITTAAGSSLFAAHLQALTNGLVSNPGASGVPVPGSKEQLAIVAPPSDAVLAAAGRTTTNRSAVANGAATAATTELPGEAATATGEPIRSVHVQLAGSGNQVVDLRVTERDGSLAVSVRSSDGALTRALQDQLPELNARLTEHHYTTEVWTPAAAANGNTRGGDDSGAGAQQQFSPGRGSQGGQAGQRQGNQQQSGQSGGSEADEQPAWLRQLAAATNK